MSTKKIFIVAFLLTVLLFATGMLLNYALDFLRIDQVLNSIAEGELDRDFYLAEFSFAKMFNTDTCRILERNIKSIKERVQQAGADLSAYGRFSFFKKKDFDYLKRKYFLLELRFYNLVLSANSECGISRVPIIFFYSIDDEPSERQGIILSDISKRFENDVVITSFDVDYKDEPAVQLLAARYSVKNAPTVVLGSSKIEHIAGFDELYDIVKKYVRGADPYKGNIDFRLVLRAAGKDIEDYIQTLTILANEEQNNLTKAEMILVLGRISENASQVCGAARFFSQGINITQDPEEKALLHETLASLQCGHDYSSNLFEASRLWANAGNIQRSQLDYNLASFTSLELNVSPYYIKPELKAPKNFTKIILGRSFVNITRKDRIVTQEDRVYRDWLGLQYQPVQGPRLLTTFSERLTYSEGELRQDIGWHEGGRLSLIKKATGAEVVPVFGTIAVLQDGKWFASDEQGIYRFEVPLDKISYPTTRFLREDIAVLVDTHGVNMLVSQALLKNASVVVSDCDHPGKVSAAKYLSDRGVKVICLPDKYAYLALGHNISLLASPPMRLSDNAVLVGSKTLTIYLNEIIIAMNASDNAYALWYYQTPASYFSTMHEAAMLNVTYFKLDNFNSSEQFYKRAEELGATVAGVRVFNSNDYDNLKKWLSVNSSRKAVLFHSASYPYGFKALNEFPSQTTFGDVNPVFE